MSDHRHDPNANRPKIIGLETEGRMDPKFGAVISYKTMPNGDHVATDGTVISTAESRARQDVPQWRKFELGRLDIVDNVVVPGPNAEPRDIAQYGENVKLTKRYQVEQRQGLKAASDKIMPDDPNHTPLEKALSWAKETRHGPQHQARWSKVAAALGADNGYPPMPLNEAEGLWERFGRNRRWTMAVNAIEKMEGDDIAAANRYRDAVGLPPVEQSQADALAEVNERPGVIVKEFDPQVGEFREVRMTAAQKRARELDFYRNGPGMQAHYSVDEWLRMNGAEPTVVLVAGWNRLAIMDPARGVPTYWLEGEGVPVETWKHTEGEWEKVDGRAGEAAPAERRSHAAGGEHARVVDDTRRVPADIMRTLPALTEPDWDAYLARHKGDSLCCVQQAEPAEGPIVERVLFHDGKPVARKQHRLAEFDHLPRMTPDEAQHHFTKVLKVASYFSSTMDGYWGTVRGWTHPSTRENVAIMEFPGAREMIGAPPDIATAIAAGDWAEVARLAAARAG